MYKNTLYANTPQMPAPLWYLVSAAIQAQPCDQLPGESLQPASVHTVSRLTLLIQRIWSIKNRLLKLCNLMVQVGLLNDISVLRKVSMNPFYMPLPETREDCSVQRESSPMYAPCSQYHVCVLPSLEFGANSIEFIDVNRGCCRHGSQGGHPHAWTLKGSIPLGSSRLRVACL